MTDWLSILLQTATDALATASPSPIPTPATGIDLANNWLTAVTAVLGIIGTFGGWIWGRIEGYKKAKHERPDNPRGAVTVTAWAEPAKEGYIPLHVIAAVANKGDILLTISSVYARVQQMSPLDPSIVASLQAHESPVVEGYTEVGYPQIAEAKDLNGGKPIQIEKGDQADSSVFDFFIPAEVELVRLYAFGPNHTNKEGNGWWDTGVYDLRTNRMVKFDSTGSETKQEETPKEAAK